MRLVIQRVSQAQVEIEHRETQSIGSGLMILVGVEHADTQEDARWLAGKVVQMRIFPDSEGKMNASLLDIGGDILLISQFTLHASTKKGNRPSFIKAAPPLHAKALYEFFQKELENQLAKPVKNGVFGAHMNVSLTNDGPVTILMDSQNRE